MDHSISWPVWSFWKPLARTAVIAAMGASVIGCTLGQDELSREDKVAIGTIGGAVIGGLIGYELLGAGQGRYITALALGAAGSAGGALLAERLTEFDRTAMNETAFNTLQNGASGETATWDSTRTGTQGSITPLRTFLDSQGRICREYDAEVSVQGESVTGRETACMTKAGHWVVFASPS